MKTGLNSEEQINLNTFPPTRPFSSGSASLRPSQLLHAPLSRAVAGPSQLFSAALFFLTLLPLLQRGSFHGLQSFGSYCGVGLLQ